MKFLGIFATIALCFLSQNKVEARTIKAVASFTVLADVIKQVGGTHVNVISLVPPEGDPHEFEPSPDDAKHLRTADLIFISGEGLETWFSRLALVSGYKGRPIVVSKGVNTRMIKEDGHIIVDPHVWNSISNVEIWVKNIAQVLSKADPEDARDFASNAARYIIQLQALDRDAHARLDPIPISRRKILTNHDAFGYFGRDYGITFLSPVGISTEAEPSAADVATIIRQIRQQGGKVFFFENSTDPRLVQQIAAEAGVHSGGKLYVESLSPPNGPAPTYMAMFQHNVDQIVKALSH
ncbi:MAG: metal ABC transporter substrate-binding protein [Zymomonas mobilis subsp. pomaceae]|uniref:Periplasmic solute binding protein n=1 Tax=Zymomonas mobilis subsp. pomaceae (strain ATCC 29192 / DSM 22645 / JCM 10191 / CCUG 17912 / NBRC 13757 / NCIMB 11200 / NRRL B-4491 / Barker I) TaxID=579138 RepID=F8EW19_ZYMMT|nr:metal ABC transporter substrate-binding protein [Zymomonas mobilis]AEI38429.1 periplasmic solute binding protein [Zymomonas mobilis subsp. pomaceae ATCC 29192]MDX5948118.1 metal ABC transporter substrate-binding protein [Zymomonas mobilis subsp. pomaceae]GEB89771.1 metal ABC transporter substrate-binding protein [Zymomonas mobilis subsp. pomaceae]